ncbi:MAG: hypothetical protein DME76_16145 [Verrucomicrobia bacterium]|nr:MAG: hypothetical protein DME76_16145 [Verrucomicrobiota bacterium]
MNTLAERYAQMRDTTRVHERALFVSPRIPSELELQARWFAGDFGKHFVSTTGDKIDIVQFGVWNREAGPDFRDAAIRINGSEPIRGCIEIDLLARSWETHGHATNPAFEATVLHVFVERTDREFFTRTESNRNVPQVCIDPSALPEVFNANVPLARPGRCQAPLRDLPEERVCSVLDASAQFRLRQKANRIRTKIDVHGRDETLFQEIGSALGYKENKLPFTLLAQRLPLRLLRENVENCEALLFGVAGFLETPDLDVYKKSARGYVRQLWDGWWPHRDDLRRLILPVKSWRASGTRPLNHPQRRLAALAILVREWSVFRRSMDSAGQFRLPSPQPSPTGRVAPFSRREKARMRAPHNFLTELEHPFWNFHYTLTSQASPKKMALIGDSRVADILANVLFPFWVAHDAEASTAPGTRLWTEYAKLPAQLSNRRLETAATRLFGNDPRRKQFLRTVAHQQGLLQIYEDFCMQDNSDCAQCPFPEQMAKWV